MERFILGFMLFVYCGAFVLHFYFNRKTQYHRFESYGEKIARLNREIANSKNSGHNTASNQVGSYNRAHPKLANITRVDFKKRIISKWVQHNPTQAGK